MPPTEPPKQPRPAFEWIVGLVGIAGFIVTLILGWDELKRKGLVFRERHPSLTLIVILPVVLFVVWFPFAYVLEQDQSRDVPYPVVALVVVIALVLAAVIVLTVGG